MSKTIVIARSEATKQSNQKRDCFSRLENRDRNDSYLPVGFLTFDI